MVVIMKNRFIFCVSVGGNYVFLVWCVKCIFYCFVEIKYEEYRNLLLNIGKFFFEIILYNKELCVFLLKLDMMFDIY